MRTCRVNFLGSIVFLAVSCGRCDEDGPTDDCAVHSESDSDVVDLDEDGFPVGQDCDDTNPYRYPGAEEICDGVDNDCDDLIDDIPSQADLCDGIDNDCDGVVDEDEILLFESNAGDVVDYSAELLIATASDPLQIAVSDDGEIRVCGGERRFLLLDISASVIVTPANPSMAVEVSAGDAMVTVVDVRADSEIAVTLDGLTIRDGVGDCEVDGRLTGGGVCCVGDARLELQGMTLEGNSAGDGRLGGGMMTQGCTVIVENTLVSGNSAVSGGGGILVSGGEVEVVNSEFTGNDSSSGGSAIQLRAGWDGTADVPAFVYMENSIVRGNFSGPAVAIVGAAEFECVGDAVGLYGIVQNSADSGAVFIQYDSYGFTGTNCDMGSAADGNDNSGPDVYGDGDPDSWTADIGNDATFFCSIAQGGCTIE